MHLARQRVEPALNIVRRLALGEQDKKSLPSPKRNASEIFVEEPLDVVFHRIIVGEASEVVAHARSGRSEIISLLVG